MSYQPHHGPVTDQRHGAARAVSATHAWVWAVVTLGYMLPWAISASRGARKSAGVFWVNLLAGWTCLGWIVALVMAFDRHRYVPVSSTVTVYTPPAASLPMAAPAMQPPVEGRWHPDPTGRHQLRWWDGQVWTERVMDGDTETVDPL